MAGTIGEQPRFQKVLVHKFRFRGAGWINKISRIRQQFKRRLRRPLWRHMRAAMGMWREVASIDQGKKQDIRRLLINALSHSSLLLVIEKRIQFFTLMSVTGSLMLGWFLIFYHIIPLVDNFPKNYEDLMFLSWVIFGGFFYVIFSVGGLKLSTYLFPRFVPIKGYRESILLISLSLIGIGSWIMFYHGTNLIYSSLSITCLASGSLLIVHNIAITATVFMNNIWERRLESQFPVPCLTFALLHAIWALENSQQNWSPTDRAKIARALEEAARIIRCDLFRSLEIRDTAAWLWREERAQKIANAFQEKVRWLITPKEDTRIVLRDRLALAFLAIIQGEWDQLEVADAPNVTWSQRYTGLMIISKNVVTAFLPLAIFILLRYLAIVEIGSPAKDYIVGGLVVWAALALISGFDPNLKERAEVLRDILSIVKMQKREK